MIGSTIRQVQSASIASSSDPVCGPAAPDCGPFGDKGGWPNNPLSDFSLQSLFDHRRESNPWYINGNLLQSFTINFAQPVDRFNGPVIWTDRSNEYQLNQLWLNMGRSTDTTRRDWDIGGQISLLYGTNYRWTTTAGFEDRWGFNTHRSFYGLVIPNLHGEIAYKNTNTKVGRFVSPIGYFTVNSAENFFNTLPYTYPYGEPLHHWGTLTTWTLNDSLSIGGGVIAGWDNFDGSGAGSKSAGGIGTATYTFEDKSSLTWVGLISREFNNRGAVNDPNNYTPRYAQTLVYQRSLTDRLTYVAHTAFGIQSGVNDYSFTREIGTARWYGLNQYLYWRQSDLITWGLNFEWFRDESGFRVGSVLPTSTTPFPESQVRGFGQFNQFGYAGNFHQITFGPRITPRKNLFIRPNLRFDWFSGDALNGPGNTTVGAALPFVDGRRSQQAILATDIGILF
jgi:hypothetical protein